MGKSRKYSFKDVDVLMTAQTIATSFDTLLPELSLVRTDWTSTYSTALKTKIDNVLNTQLGVDSKKSLREASALLESIMLPAQRDVAFFKTQIDGDFKKEPAKRDEILKTLGFTKSLKEVQIGKHHAMVQLLYSFKTNMTETLRKDITAKGMNDSLIATIISYADSFKSANITQENFKETTKGITKEMADSFNDIYDEIIDICKKVSAYYKNEPLKKEQFNFSKIIGNIGKSRKPEEKPVVELVK